jgi:NAD(P)-dependent dehydrogenase (short-subunit alcohol dehydrogenase family)
VELAPKIRVNTVSAGSIRTDLRRSAGAKRADELPPPPPDTVAGKMPRPVADARQVAYVNLFLVSHEGSFVNGHALVADGGRSIVSG